MEDGLYWQRPNVRSPTCKLIRVIGSVERANFRGLVLNGMMEKKEKNTRNNPKILRLIKCENDNKYILNTSLSQVSLHQLSHLNLTTILLIIFLIFLFCK